MSFSAHQTSVQSSMLWIPYPVRFGLCDHGWLTKCEQSGCVTSRSKQLRVNVCQEEYHALVINLKGEEHCAPVWLPQEDSNYKEIAKIITLPTTKSRSLNISSHYILLSKSPRKTQYSQTLNCDFTNTQKRQRKISFNSGQWHVANRSLPATDAGQTPLLCLKGRILSPPQRGQIGLWSCSRAMCFTYLSRTKEHSLSVKQGKIVPYEMIKPAQAMWTLHLLVKKCSRLKPHSYVAKWGVKRQCAWDCFSKNVLHLFSLWFGSPVFQMV